MSGHDDSTAREDGGQRAADPSRDDGGQRAADPSSNDGRWEPVEESDRTSTADRASDRTNGDDEPHPMTTENGESSVPAALADVGRVIKRFLQVLARIAFAGGLLLLGRARNADRDDPLREWLLLSGSRWTVIWTMTVSFFLLCLSLGAVDIIGISEADFVVEMFSTIIAGLFSFTPVVVGVNSLSMTGLSSSLGGIEKRIESVEEFRNEVAALSPTTVVTPTDPAGFIDVATDTLHERVESLREEITAVDEPARSDIQSVVADVEDAVAGVERVAQNDPSVIDVLVPMMNDDYSRDINRIRQLKRVYTELPSGAREDLSDIHDLLESLDVTRAYFKTMYLQQELAKFSRYIAYASINALLWSMFVIMTFANGVPSVGHGSEIVVLVSVGMTAAFLPFAILFSYILRIATVIKQTSAPGAFTPQKENSEGS
jgi:hypothetical protein